jgi:non-canonical poly(A) RNA polymerase PAPD5/7
MDLVMLSDEFERRGRYGFAKKALFKIANDLQSARITTREDTQVIHRAKVPIVKFVDTLTGLHCDLSLDNDSGLHALTTFEKWRRTWPFLPKLLSVLKQWLLMRDMNEVFSGGLGGFSLTCMVVSMLQRMPSSQTAHIDGGGRLGELLLEFFHLYGNKFNMDNVGISLNPAEYFDKVKDNDWWRALTAPKSNRARTSVSSTKALADVF